MSKYIRSPLTGDLAGVNAELEKIKVAIDSQLDRNPPTGAVNQLGKGIDANSNRLYNLPAPQSPTDAARLQDVQASNTGTGVILPDPTGQADEFLRTDGTTAYWEAVTPTVVGLGNVDNTTDLSKPVSTAQAAEITKRVRSIDTFVNLEALVASTTGEAFECQERANAPYILQPSGYVALAGDATLANGRIAALQINGYNLVTFFASVNEACSRGCLLEITTDTTITIPTDYPDWITPFNLIKSKSIITVNIATGHSPITSINLANGEWGNFKITSTDAEVTIGAAFPTTSSIINVTNARAPVLDCLIDTDGQTTVSAYNFSGAATGLIKIGAGMKNGGDRGLHAQNASVVYANGSIFTGFQAAGVHASRASIIQCADAVLTSNSQNASNTFGAIYASRGSTIHCPDVDASNSGAEGVRSQRLATIVCPDVNLTNCTGTALVANGGFIMCDSGVPVLVNLSGQAVVIASGGQIHLGAVTITHASGVTDPSIEVRNGRLVARNINVSGYQGRGVFAEGANALVDLDSATFAGGTEPLYAFEGATINAANATVTGASGSGSFARAGAKIILTGASITGSTGDDLVVSEGSWIAAKGCTTTNGAGSPNSSDTNLTGGFNFANNGDRGFIWS